MDFVIETRLLIAIGTCLSISSAAFLSSSRTGNYSFIDRAWSIAPVLYAWILNGTTFNTRSLLMTLFITAWGVRLTFNFKRRGGYKAGEQDYRWPVLQTIITNKIAWNLFNFLFISFYQNALLLAITLPVYFASLSANSWTYKDSILLASLSVFLFGEWLADQQQYEFQTEKWRLIKSGQALESLPVPFVYGFNTTGLFRYSRHPNFFAEITIWILLSLFTLQTTHESPFYSHIGAFLLFTLFIGSTAFTESITASKYPLYSAYQSSTSSIVPFFAAQFNGRAKIS